MLNWCFLALELLEALKMAAKRRSIGFGKATREDRLDVDLMASLKPARVFHIENDVRANSIDFDAKGDLMVTGNTDDSIRLYDVDNASEKKVLFVKSHGARLVRMSHGASTVLVASDTRNREESIRYMSLHDNRYLRYFKGHTAEVSSLEISPIYDGFLSAAADNTVRFWDLRTNACQGLINTPVEPGVAYGPEGLVFAVVNVERTQAGQMQTVIRMYDARGADKGPFICAKFPDEMSMGARVSFSPCGKYLLVPLVYGHIALVNSYDGNVERYLEMQDKGTKERNREVEREVSKDSILQACFTPDSAFILGSSETGVIYVWNASSGEKVTELTGHHENQAVSNVQWNPKKVMFASAGEDLAFWLPKLD